MSYSIQEAKMERTEAISKAIEERDETKLYELAHYAKKEGDDELADFLKKEYNKVYREDRAYDESIGN